MKDYQYTLILLRLPNGKLILQRRTADAPLGAARLGFFGGHIEPGETPDECVAREIEEETSLKASQLKIHKIAEFDLKIHDFPKERKFYLYEAAIDNDKFDIFEGDGAESYSVADIKKRSDLTSSAQYVIDNLVDG